MVAVLKGEKSRLCKTGVLALQDNPQGNLNLVETTNSARAKWCNRELCQYSSLVKAGSDVKPFD